MSEERCVMCGEIIPEGRMVCPSCERTNSTTTLQMLPVCECGQVIGNLQTEIDIKPIGNMNYLFSPSCCPNCGKPIKRIEIYNKYLKLFND